MTPYTILKGPTAIKRATHSGECCHEIKYEASAVGTRIKHMAKCVLLWRDTRCHSRLLTPFL